MKRYDVIIIGCGIAGAGLAAALAGICSVAILEMENQAGYHSTGRSNALYHETYGGPQVQPLTTASREEMAQGGYLAPRPTITLGKPDERAALDAFESTFSAAGVALSHLDRSALVAALPGIKPEWTNGILEHSSADIDVSGLHQGWLKAARGAAVELFCSSAVSRIEKLEQGWRLWSGDQSFDASIIVNASGAWADDIAKMAGVKTVGLTPYRRTIAQLELADPIAADGPMVNHIGGAFYFRPAGGNRLWVSPHDETPSPPCDAAPEEIDVAIAIDRLEQVMEWRVKRVEHKWAGLRTFAPDRSPVFGFAPDAKGFFWCAGQGGFGIQTAPAASQLCATLITGNTPPSSIEHIDAAAYSPARFA